MNIFTETHTGPLDVARAEYAKYCRMITGGEGPRATFAVDESLDKTHDEYRIVTDGDGVKFTGASGRSVLYAVYDFLERRGGCAWFWDGDRVPQMPVIDCSGLDVREKARFEYRGLRYFAHRSLHRFQAEQWDFDDWKREIDWICKRRLDLFMLRTGIGDLFQKAFPEIVPYPEDGFSLPESSIGGYNNRDLFWPMKDCSELRRKVLAYARERGLVHPEDCGTMSHWYSRTPRAYLDKVKPGFLPQANMSQYGQPTGLVWDIRKDENLDAYFKLTEAHIREYGGGEAKMFHTIGLGERLCYADRAQNHAMKLYTYDRIIGHLRKSHPDTPLLIATWDFISTWSPAEVRELTARLDPKNTIMLDYTSDIWDNDDNFINWDFIGNFPWIFGIFHAYEASNEIRGNYGIIRQRFPKAAADPMCKGVCFWPENSHADTLMLDYFSAIAWNPSDYKIEEYVGKFCRRRYGEKEAAAKTALWTRFLPLAEASRWGTQNGNGYRYQPCREFYPDIYCNLHGWFFGDDAKYRPVHIEYYNFIVNTLGRLMDNARDTLRVLAGEDFAAMDEMTRRDMIDIARTVAARMIELGIATIGASLDRYTVGGDADELRAAIDRTQRMGRLFTRILESSREFSLNAALEDIARYPHNPNFEKVLKDNCAGSYGGSYCHAHVYELAKGLFEPTFAAFASWAKKRLDAGDRSLWNGTAAEQDALYKAVHDKFMDTPLADNRPDCGAALGALPGVLAELAAEAN